MGQSVQFRTKKAVEDAYLNRNVATFGIWQGKQFMFKGESVEDLEHILEALENGGSISIYTLKVFEGKESDQVKNNTPDDGSFNFRLKEGDSSEPGRETGLYYRISEIEKKIGSIADKMENTDEDDEEIKEPEGNELKKLLIPLLPVLMEKILSFLNDKKIPEQLPERVTDKSEAYNKLAAKVPGIDEKLNKLNEMSENNPELFNQLINSL